MKKLKVLDFDYGCGGFTKGLEDSGLFRVISNGSINDKNKFCYNKIHKKNFDKDDIIKKEADLVVFTPNLGQKLNRSGWKNFFQKELDNFCAFLLLYDFDNVIFLTKIEAYQSLQFFSEVMRTTDNFPTKDIISCRLLNMGYNVFHFVFDGAGFGLPQHKMYSVYWGSRITDKSIEIKEGFGMYKRPYRLVKHLISDIDDNTKLSWHTPDYRKKNECSFVAQGGSARKTINLSQSRGFVRLDANKMSPLLSYDFYNTSSKGPSINPWFDRPLTIREGARLFGLTDDFDWDKSLSKKDVAMMIYESFPPVISELMSRRISKLIR